MSKKVQKTLTAALATTLATGSMAIPAMAAPVGANNDLDALYKAAYEATVKTQNLDKVTQNDINVAREAINKLRGTSVASAVPTFSSIVDKAQQKFLEIAYNSIVKCQETGTQKDINTARTNIQDLPLEFKNAYSMAIDAVQQKVIDKVYAAVEEAIKTQNPKDIEKAQALLDDILTVVHNDGVKKWAVETEVRFKKATAVLNIVSAEALNNNSVTVVFNRPINPKSATVENFSVSPKGEAYDNLIVDKVEVAKDGMSVKIHTINTFQNKKDYVVNVSKIKDTFGNEIVKNASAEFNYQIAAVKSIAFTATNIPLEANLKNYVVIKDTLGRDVTDQYKDKLSFTSSNLNLVDANGVVTKEEPKEGQNRVVVSVTVDGTDIKATNTLTITKSAAETFAGYAMVKTNYDLGDKTLSEISSNDKLNYVTVGENTAKLILGFKDQFGKELSAVQNFKVLQNYNPGIAIVKDDGKIDALSTGTAYVKVKYGAIEKTISIEVKAASVPASISTAKDNYSLVATNTAGININYVINDQYGNKYNGNLDVTTDGQTDTDNADRSQLITNYTIKNSNGNIANDDFIVNKNAKNGQITITPLEGKTQTGTYKLTLERKFQYDGKTTTITKNININVIEGGQLTGFKAQIDHTELDVSSQNDSTGLQKSAQLTVYRVDASGNELGTVKFSSDNKEENDEVSLQILDSNQNDVTNQNKLSVTLNTGVNSATIKAEKSGTYTVKVKVGSQVIQQITIKVINTQAKPTTISVNSRTATIDEGKTVKDLLADIGCTVKNQFGKDINDGKLFDGPNAVTKINYYLANESGASVVQSNGEALGTKDLTNVFDFTGINQNGDKTSKGTLDFVIKSMTVKDSTEESGQKIINFNTPLTIKVTVNNKNIDFDANVNIQKAKVAAETALKEAKDATKDLTATNVTIEKAKNAVEKANNAVNLAEKYNQLAGADNADAKQAVKDAKAQLKIANDLMKQAQENENANKIAEVEKQISENHNTLINCKEIMSDKNSTEQQKNEASEKHTKISKEMLDNLAKLINISKQEFKNKNTGDTLTVEILKECKNNPKLVNGTGVTIGKNGKVEKIQVSQLNGERVVVPVLYELVK